MTKAPGFELNSRILCQDVRQEKTNKYIIIGVYSGHVVVSEFPAKLRFCVYCDGVVRNANTKYLCLRTSWNGKPILEMGMAFNKNAPDNLFSFSSPEFEIACDQPGELMIEASEDRKTWFPFLTKKILQGQVDGLNPMTKEIPPELRREETAGPKS